MSSGSRSSTLRPLSSLATGTRGVVVRVAADERADRLAAFGVTPGATVRVLQRFPGVVFECDETELAVEHPVAHLVIVEVR